MSVYEEAVPDANLNRRLYGALRHLGVWPTRYMELKTPVTVDVLEAGLILAAVMLAFCFYIVIIPSMRNKEGVFSFIRVTVSLFLGTCTLLCNWGQEWETDKIHTHTQYKAFTMDTIEADIGVKIGLRNVNITLRASNESEHLLGEKINYNERFWWSYPWTQGRIGFGPYAFEFNQEYRAAQRKGLPYPVLWVAEYFHFDGEGIRWGRNYRTAGWYSHIMLWCAFVAWVLANVLYFMNPRFGAYMTVCLGGFMLLANLLFGSIRNYNPLVIPFDGVALRPTWGWCFWLNLFAGLLSVMIGVFVCVLDFFIPEAVATFFSVDVLKDYEEFYPEVESEQPAQRNGHTTEAPATRTGSGAHAGQRQSVVAVPQFRKRGPTLRGTQKKRPQAPPRTMPQEKAGGDMELYENAPMKGTAALENVTFETE